jgi:hypothetical protein
MIWPEVEYLQELERIEEDCRKVPALLTDLARRRGVGAASPQVIAMISQVSSIGQHCREERERFGLWREDGLQSDEIIEAIYQQLAAFVATLESALPKRKDATRKI